MSPLHLIPGHRVFCAKCFGKAKHSQGQPLSLGEGMASTSRLGEVVNWQKVRPKPGLLSLTTSRWTRQGGSWEWQWCSGGFRCHFPSIGSATLDDRESQRKQSLLAGLFMSALYWTAIAQGDLGPVHRALLVAGIFHLC